MDEKIYNLVRKLKEEIDRDPRFIRLNELEKKMSEDEEVMLLSYKDDKEVIEARNELIKRKDELDSHPIVKEYLSALNEVRKIIFEMNNIIFGSFKEEKR